MKKMLMVHAVAVSCLAAFAEQEVNLNEHALRDGAGKLIVLSSGDPGFVRDDGTHEIPESAFDGNWDTLYKPLNTEVANIWVGLEFDCAYVISRVDYVGPEWYWWGAGNRTKGCVIEGANSADFSDAEVIATLGNSGRAMATVRTSGAGAAKTWKFARIRSPRAMIGDDDDSTCCGNIAELVFYGYEPEVQALPSVPTIKTLQVYNRSAAISYDVPSDAFAVELQIRTAPDGEWRMVKEKSSALRDVAKYRVQLDAVVGAYCAVRARSVNTSGVSEWSSPEVLEDIPTALFGRVIGTRDGDQSAAFDGDFTTRTEQGEDWGRNLI